MDQIKTGRLIRKLRTQLGYTQIELAEMLHVSDKAVSKWECGKGCPDISLLSELADVLGVDMQSLLSGELSKNESEKGNMKKLKFYVCRDCGNIITAATEANITCCGHRLTAEEPVKASESEQLRVENIDDEWYISSDHEMTKEHYISFVAYVSESTAVISKQYPEWSLQVRLPLYRSGRLVWYCTKCGLFYQDISRNV